MVRRRGFALSMLLTALILLPVMAVAGPAASGLAKGELARPYTLATLNDMTFNRIDPDTLVTMQSYVWMGGVNDFTPPEIYVSGDGSTIAIVRYRGRSNPGAVIHRKDVTIHLLDARNGAQLTSFHPRVAMSIDGLSNDGKELYGYGLQSSTQPQPWYAIDAQTGRLKSRMLLANYNCCPFYDSAANRVYVLHTFPFDQKTHKPQAPVLSSYDQHGQLDRAVRLDGVMAGWGDSGRQENGNPVMEGWSPGLALSPDGSQLAILDGASNTLRIVDAHTMSLVRTETLSQPQSPLSHLADLLGILPTTAEAKEIEGVDLSMNYSPDGRSLYVTGMRGSFDSSGKFGWHNLGLRRIDVQTGTVEATAFQDQALWWSQLAPDGSAFYALTPAARDYQGNDACPCALERLDPRTLAVTAKRMFDADTSTGSPPQFYILAAPLQ
ncbi:MAG: hypothetical protein M3Z66_18570 [Chloroflexota bacterium]|nr:hypothetical protein [Chloroflexota bacterium]